MKDRNFGLKNAFRSAFALGFVFACVSVGCAPNEAYQGDSSVLASYKGGNLSAVIGAEHRVPAVLAAAEQALRDRGYTIVSNLSTEDAGTLIARPPRYNTFPRLMVRAGVVPGGTRIELEYQPLGNEEVCRATLDATLKRLGL
mgnify:CR=1 FL=1